jgi:hypothetical protein
LSLALDGVSAAWVTEQQTPHGFLVVDRALLEAHGIEPLEVELGARIEVEGGLWLPRWQVRGDGLQLQGRGRITPDDGVQMTASGWVDLAAADRIVRARGNLDGAVRIAAVLDTSRVELVQLELTGRRVEAARFPLGDLRSRLVVERDGIRGVLEHATFHGGTLTGRYRLDHLRGPTRPHRIELHGQGISLARFLTNLRIPTANLGARFAVDAELEWNGRQVRQGAGVARAEFRPSSAGLPVRGTVRCDITPNGLLQFAAEELELGRSIVNWQGPLTIGTWEPAWSVTANPAVLEEAIPLVNRWARRQLLPESITGLAELQVTLSGPWHRLAVGTRIDAQDVRLLPIELDRLVAEAAVHGSELRLGTSRFSIQDGHGEVEGSVAWSPEVGSEQLDLTIRGHRLPIERLAGLIGADNRATGFLSFTGGLRGPVAQPRGSWAVGIDDATLMGQPLGDGSATVDLVADRFEGHGIRFEQGLEGEVWWDLTSGDVGGDLKWPSMPITALGDAVVRLVGDRADVSTSFLMPRHGNVSGLVEVVCPDARIQAEARNGEVRVAASLADTIVGRVELQRTGSGDLVGGGELRLESAEQVVSRLLPESRLPLQGTARAAIDVVWPTDGLPVVSGRIDAMDLRLDDRPVRLLAPAPFTVSSLGLQMEGLRVAVLDDELFTRWQIGPDGTLAGNASGTLDALLLRFLIPDWEPAGRATGVVELLGTLERPMFEGIAELDQGSFRLPQTRTILSGIDGTLLLSSDELILEGVDFRIMQGNGRCGGQIALRDGAILLGLNGAISGLRYEIFPGLIAFLSGTLRLEGPTDALELAGDLIVDRASLRRKDDVPTMLIDWFGTEAPPPRSGGPELDLHIEADESIEVRNPFVGLVGSASLDISGTASEPGIVGKIEFEEGGEVMLQTVRYELERGSLTFSDPTTVEPLIELQASTWVQNYQITVRLTGTPDRLVPSVASNPPLSEGDIYSLLAVGYRDENLGSGAMGVGLASTVLTREIAAELDRRTRTLLPVDQIRVDPFTETSTGNPTARISVVKQLSPNWTFIVQTNISAEREEVVVSRWYLAPGLFVEASRDIDGSYGVDLKLRRPY